MHNRFIEWSRAWATRDGGLTSAFRHSASPISERLRFVAAGAMVVLALATGCESSTPSSDVQQELVAERLQSEEVEVALTFRNTGEYRELYGDPEKACLEGAGLLYEQNGVLVSTPNLQKLEKKRVDIGMGRRRDVSILLLAGDKASGQPLDGRLERDGLYVAEFEVVSRPNELGKCMPPEKWPKPTKRRYTFEKWEQGWRLK